ncbi:MAG TPA: hypothetical protein VE987_06740, partial [Polyangiaceae bacterium]|nr:hypothetical protein [Polyangiaceae bacterium]
MGEGAREVIDPAPGPAGDVGPFSLVRGGPFRRLLRAVRLARDDGRDVRRQSAALVAITWAPMVVLGAAQRAATGRWPPLLLDPSTHARLLLTIPLLVAAEHALHERSGRCVDRFVRSGLAAAGPAATQRVLALGARLRDARLPEAALAVLALAAGQAALWGLAAPGAATGPAVKASAAGVWWSLVGLPLSQFLLYRSL